MENEITTEQTNAHKENEQSNATPKNNPWDLIGGDYVKLEQNKAKILTLTNWKIEKITKFKDEKTGLPKETLQFSAEVVKEDGIGIIKTFTTTSFNALNGLKKILGKYYPDNKTPRTVKIVKMGEGRTTVYFIEEIL